MPPQKSSQTPETVVIGPFDWCSRGNHLNCRGFFHSTQGIYGGKKVQCGCSCHSEARFRRRKRVES